MLYNLLMKRIFPFMAILIISLVYFSGAVTAPFHPDEATQIFMSADVQDFFQNPSHLFWQPGKEGDQRQRYRELDAPLTRTLIGIGLWITDTPALNTDWDWSKSWKENQQAGALPDSQTLLISRMSVMFLFPFTLWAIYQSGWILMGSAGAWAGLVLAGFNALILLHTRRAMAESVLLFTIAVSLWCMLSLKRHPWLIAIPVAFAFNAKQSSAPLMIIGLFSLIWSLKPTAWLCKIKDIAIYSLLILFITFLLNPFLWKYPLQATQQAVSARSDLLARQTEEIAAQNPNQVLSSPLERTIGMTAQLYLTPLAFEDVGNYLAETRPATDAYLSNPINRILRNPIGGSILLILALMGCVLAARKMMRERSRGIAILLLGTITQAGFLIWLIPLPFQRYYLPLLPWLILLTAFPFSVLTNSLLSHRKKVAGTAESHK